MSVLNRRVSLCFGLLVVLAGCSGDDSNGGGGNSVDASMEAGTTGDDAAACGDGVAIGFVGFDGVASVCAFSDALGIHTMNAANSSATLAPRRICAVEITYLRAS